VWIVIWRVKFESMEKIFGLLGLAMVVFAVALWKLHPDWGSLTHDATHPSVQSGEGRPTYFYYAIALFGAAMTPYEVFFFSSGAVEEKWSLKDLHVERANVYIGFPLGGLLSLAIMGCAALVLLPRGIAVAHLSQVALPASVALGKIGLAFILLGFFAATFGAALETALSSGYTVAQFFGWQWGKYVKPKEAARFHAVVILSVLLAAALALTTIDPIKVTEYSIVFSAIALPLTYFPIFVIANDRGYMGDKTNSKLSNALGTVYLIVIVVASLAAIPLMLATKAGE
jgi:Mn2+/Fe2+ NRAMP family transporter